MPDTPIPIVRTTRVLDPEQIAMQAGTQIPTLRLPERGLVFGDRALRLRQLAADHPMREYLQFVAEIATAQHDVLQKHGPVAVPDASAIDAAARALKPPVPAFGWPRDPAWLGSLRAVLARLRERTPAGPARDTLDRVAAADDGWLDAQADLLSRRSMLGLDLAAAPLVAAGLQVYWTHLVLQIKATHGDKAFGTCEPATQCPCCGSTPTASVTRIGADEAGFRYLHCALCSAEWHYVRIKCAHCEATSGIHFEELVANDVSRPAGLKPGAVKAECCDTCGHYLKQVAMEKDPEVEPVADDLASIALDLLVSENSAEHRAYERSGHNLMLLFGDPDPIDDDGGGG